MARCAVTVSMFVQCGVLGCAMWRQKGNSTNLSDRHREQGPVLWEDETEKCTPIPSWQLFNSKNSRRKVDEAHKTANYSTKKKNVKVVRSICLSKRRTNCMPDLICASKSNWHQNMIHACTVGTKSRNGRGSNKSYRRPRESAHGTLVTQQQFKD